MTKNSKRDNEIMRLLKIVDIGHIIATSSKGNITLNLRKGGEDKDYFFCLDSVPCDKEMNDDLSKLITW